MSDLIDRQRALDAFDYWVKSPMIGYSNGLLRLREMLEEIPPAKPEPKVSEWIYGCSNDMGYSEDYDMTCKACGKSMLKNDYIFCPYCGSLNYIPHTEPAPISSKRVVDFEKGVVRYASAKENEE